jgi:putative ABC transport system ATP-binding protein
LVTDAPIILCDEPTANLDRANKEIFLDILYKLHLLKKTIVVSTHDPIFQNLKYIDRVINVENGEILK